MYFLLQVKKHRHDNLGLHGAGKHLPKGEASRVIRHLVVEDILVEDVRKSDIYGSISSVLKVYIYIRDIFTFYSASVFFFVILLTWLPFVPCGVLSVRS